MHVGDSLLGLREGGRPRGLRAIDIAVCIYRKREAVVPVTCSPLLSLPIILPAFLPSCIPLSRSVSLPSSALSSLALVSFPPPRFPLSARQANRRTAPGGDEAADCEASVASAGAGVRGRDLGLRVRHGSSSTRDLTLHRYGWVRKYPKTAHEKLAQLYYNGLQVREERECRVLCEEGR